VLLLSTKSWFYIKLTFSDERADIFTACILKSTSTEAAQYHVSISWRRQTPISWLGLSSSTIVVPSVRTFSPEVVSKI